MPSNFIDMKIVQLRAWNCFSYTVPDQRLQLHAQAIRQEDSTLVVLAKLVVECCVVHIPVAKTLRSLVEYENPRVQNLDGLGVRMRLGCFTSYYMYYE
jgi:hypothetical protein